MHSKEEHPILSLCSILSEAPVLCGQHYILKASASSRGTARSIKFLCFSLFFFLHLSHFLWLLGFCSGTKWSLIEFSSHQVSYSNAVYKLIKTKWVLSWNFHWLNYLKFRFTNLFGAPSTEGNLHCSLEGLTLPPFFLGDKKQY